MMGVPVFLRFDDIESMDARMVDMIEQALITGFGSGLGGPEADEAIQWLRGLYGAA